MSCYRSHKTRKVRAMGGVDPVAVARTVVELTRDGRVADVADLFGAHSRAVAPAEPLRAGWPSELPRTGPVRSIGDPEIRPAAAGLVRVSVPVTGEHGSPTAPLSGDGTGRVGGPW